MVHQAMVVIVQQGAAQFNMGGLLHDGFWTFAVFFCPVQFALDARGGGQDRRRAQEWQNAAARDQRQTQKALLMYMASTSERSKSA